MLKRNRTESTPNEEVISTRQNKGPKGRTTGWKPIPRLNLRGRWLRSFFDQVAQAALGPRSCIAVNHILRSRLVQLFGGCTKLGRCSFQVSGCNGKPDFLQLGPQRTAATFVADSEFFVLAKAFFSCGCIWHGSIEIATLAEMDGLGIPKKFEPQSMASESATVQS